MSRNGAGKIDASSSWQWQGDTMWAEPILVLFNFDIDSTELKPEHEEFLRKQVIPDLSENPGASVGLVGTASRTGESRYNDNLSEKRALAVKSFLTGKGISAAKLRPSEPVAGGEALSVSKSDEDERDRAVTLVLHFPITIDAVTLRADNWDLLGWDDIIGLDRRTSPLEWINNVNIQVVAKGAPKLWVVDGGRKVPVMPDHMDVRMRSRAPKKTWAPATILVPKILTVPVDQPDTPSSDPGTKYRLSMPISEAGDFLTTQEGEFREVATVSQSGGTAGADFRAALGWASRGNAEQNRFGGGSGAEDTESIDDVRLLQAGGVEVLEVEGLGKANPQTKVAKRLVRNPADVFYYSGNGDGQGCLLNGKDCTISARDLQKYWGGKRKALDLEVLILSTTSVLDATSSPDGTTVVSGPAVEWSKLLKRNGGPLTAVLGYSDSAPADRRGNNAISADMGKRIAAGLDDKQWVQAWLAINAAHKLTDAVGIDEQGYWWLENRSTLEHMYGPVRRLFDKYNLIGPVKIG